MRRCKEATCLFKMDAAGEEFFLEGKRGMELVRREIRGS